LPLERGNRLAADATTLATSRPGIFAAGDVVYGTKSVISAIAAGRTAAVSMDRYLGGTGQIEEILAPVHEPESVLGLKEGFALAERGEEPEAGMETEEALAESGRCLQCDLRLTIAEPKFWSSYPHH
jgi:NADPH-dependent glutamate synthase beta subunit-like oxidoreductase